MRSRLLRWMLPGLLLSACFSLPAVCGQEGKFLDKSADEWARQLKAADAKQRRSAAFALGKIGNRAADHLADLKDCLAAERDAKVREAIAFAIGDIGRESLRASGDVGLEAQLCKIVQEDDDPLVRRSAAYALGCLNTNSERARTALQAALADRESFVRQNAVWALGQAGEASLPALKKALGDTDSFVKRDAASALLQCKDGDKVHPLVPDLLPLCSDRNSEVRRAAVSVLVRIVDPTDKEALRPLAGLLEDRDVEIRRNAALAMSNIGSRDAAAAVPVLIEALHNGDAELRENAALGLRGLGPTAAPAVGMLAKVLAAPGDAKLRGYVALALGGIGSAAESAVPALVDRLLDAKENENVRYQCATALATMGANESTERAVPRIVTVLGDSSQPIKVRERVIWALRPHARNLPSIRGVFEAFSGVLREPRGANKMLRYDSAYMLGVIWQAKAPDATLDVLNEFLHDDTIKIFVRTATSVGGTGSETVGSAASAKELGRGDGRTMATQALQGIGAARYAGRAPIMQQLRRLADDARGDPDLRKQASKLVKDAT